NSSSDGKRASNRRIVFDLSGTLFQEAVVDATNLFHPPGKAVVSLNSLSAAPRQPAPQSLIPNNPRQALGQAFGRAGLDEQAVLLILDQARDASDPRCDDRD